MKSKVVIINKRTNKNKSKKIFQMIIIIALMNNNIN